MSPTVVRLDSEICRSPGSADVGAIGRARPDHGKPVVVSEFESAAWLGSLLIRISREAELDALRISDEHAVSKHYDLTGPDDLKVLLGELDALLTAGRVPGSAVVQRGVPAMDAPRGLGRAVDLGRDRGRAGFLRRFDRRGPVSRRRRSRRSTTHGSRPATPRPAPGTHAYRNPSRWHLSLNSA
ncbi:hypothetical protein JCM9534A_64580 [Catenuloplanes indicus JCM 9534]